MERVEKDGVTASVPLTHEQVANLFVNEVGKVANRFMTEHRFLVVHAAFASGLSGGQPALFGNVTSVYGEDDIVEFLEGAIESMLAEEEAGGEN